MDNIFNESIIEMLEELNDSAIFENMAKVYRKMCDALIKEGFTKEEAIVILTSQGLGLKTN
jgi:hypothetical protein